LEIKDSISFLNSIVLLFVSRAEITFAVTWTGAIGCVMASHGLPPARPTLIALATGLFLSLAVYLYNDVIDREMDAASANPRKQERPIAMGRVPVSHAMGFIYVLGVLGLFSAYLISWFAFGMSVVFLVFLTMYSYPKVRLKKRFVVKSLVTPISLSWSMIICGLAVSGNITLPIIFVAVVTYVFVFLNLPGLADSFDIKEDTEFGMKTMAMVLSWRQKILMMMLAVIIYFGATMLFYDYLGFNLVVPITVTLFSVVLLNQLRKMLEDFDNESLTLARKIAYAYTVLMPFFMAIGSLSLPFL
jgi:4-hydroxybenzoate polyprenyltransferase